ncbi:MAG: C4-dicarboxylate ABC transporter permease, partial [Pseudomonadota bacterium]
MLQLFALGIVGYYPQLVNYLPKRLQLTAETAPPPRNPKLQHCVEQYVTEQFADNSADIRSAIDKASALDYSILPTKLAKSVTSSFDEAGKTFDLLTQSNRAAVSIDDASGDFRPIHQQVRDIRTAANRYDQEIKELSTELRRLPDNATDADRAAIQSHIDELTQAKADVEATTPDTWDQTRADFTALQQQERDLRRDYRKAADKGYSPIAELQQILAGTPALKALDGEIAGLIEHVKANPPEASIDLLSAASKQFGDIDGASKIKSEISKARKALKSKKPSQEKAIKALDKAQIEYDEQMVWRDKAEQTLAATVAEYEEAIRSTIGLRQQSKLTRPQALYVAACDAGHRDISLNF